MTAKHLHVDLCAGLGGWQQPFEESPHWRSVGVDIHAKDGVDILGDVRQLPLKRCEPDLLTMSPPCQAYSTAWNCHVPLPERSPDTSVWRGCLRAVEHLQPSFWVLENVAGAQHFHGGADKSCHPYHLWGHFPPFDVGAMPPKGQHAVADGGGTQAAKIPSALADALRRSVEWYL